MSATGEYDAIFNELSRHAPMDLVRQLLARHERHVRRKLSEERAAEEGSRLVTPAGSFEVLDYTDVDADDDRVCYEVWVPRDQVY